MSKVKVERHMDNERLLEAHRSVNGLLGKLALGLERDKLNHEIVTLSEHLFGQRLASILRLDSEKQTLHLEYAPNLPDFYNEAIEGVRVGSTIGSCGAAAHHKVPVVVGNINQHVNWAPFTALTQQANLHACWSVPILSRDNKVLGTFAIYSNVPSEPQPDEMEILQMLASLYSIAIEKYLLEERLHFHASRDPLTLCYNRRVLIQKVENSFRTGCGKKRYVAAFFADIDAFKYINDRFGHEIGDQVLIDVAEWLKRQFYSCSVIGRYGGDEFVVFSCFETESEFIEFYHQVKQKLQIFCLLEEFQVSISLGAACGIDIDHDSLKQLIREADVSMYEVKREHRGLTKRSTPDFDHS